MAKAVYPLAREAFLKGLIDLSSADVKAAFIDTGTYTYNAAHEFYSDLSGVVAASGTLDNKTETGGVFDADNETVTAVTGATVEALVYYVDTGNPATSRLLAYCDSGTNIPFTPNGGDIEIQWNPSGIFSI